MSSSRTNSTVLGMLQSQGFARRSDNTIAFHPDIEGIFAYISGKGFLDRAAAHRVREASARNGFLVGQHILAAEDHRLLPQAQIKDDSLAEALRANAALRRTLIPGFYPQPGDPDYDADEAEASAKRRRTTESKDEYVRTVKCALSAIFKADARLVLTAFVPRMMEVGIQELGITKYDFKFKIFDPAYNGLTREIEIMQMTPPAPGLEMARLAWFQKRMFRAMLENCPCCIDQETSIKWDDLRRCQCFLCEVCRGKYSEKSGAFPGLLQMEPGICAQLLPIQMKPAMMIRRARYELWFRESQLGARLMPFGGGIRSFLYHELSNHKVPLTEDQIAYILALRKGEKDDEVLSTNLPHFPGGEQLPQFPREEE